MNTFKTMSDRRKRNTSDEILIEQLKSALPKNYCKTIQDKFKVSRGTVNRVLNQFDTSHPIMGELVLLAEKEKARRKEVEEQIKKIIASK